MDEEKVLTLHPQGKKGVNISKSKYDLMQSAIISCLRTKDLSHLELMDCIQKRLVGKFEGSIGWYAETVKLDLEARNLIKRCNYKKSQIYHLIE